MVRAASPVPRWLDHDYSAAIALFLGLVGALAWSGIAPASYQSVTSSGAGGLVADWGVASLRGAVTNGLMTIFFFAIGLELARELRRGTLTRPEHSLPPVLGALGGMVGTALLAALAGAVTSTGALTHAWGVPMATDIAFALGALALAGPRVPPTLRLFLLTLAVADDVLSVVVLAFTGHGPTVGGWLVVVAALVGAGLLVRLTGTPGRVVALVALWVVFAAAGVEPPLAGVAAGVLAPWRSPHEEPLEDLARRVATSLALPLFALVSCGVNWTLAHDRTTTVVSAATVVVRLLGKVLGVLGGVGLARAMGWRTHPSLDGRRLLGGAALCGCGFTVPLLFAGRLFPPGGPLYQAFAVGLLGATVLCCAVGVAILRTGPLAR